MRIFVALYVVIIFASVAYMGAYAGGSLAGFTPATVARVNVRHAGETRTYIANGDGVVVAIVRSGPYASTP